MRSAGPLDFDPTPDLCTLSNDALRVPCPADILFFEPIFDFQLRLSRSKKRVTERI